MLPGTGKSRVQPDPLRDCVEASPRRPQGAKSFPLYVGRLTNTMPPPMNIRDHVESAQITESMVKLVGFQVRCHGTQLTIIAAIDSSQILACAIVVSHRERT